MSPINPLCVIIAEVGITILGVTALWMGVDGAIFGIAIGALAGLGGYQIRQGRNKPNGKDK